MSDISTDSIGSPKNSENAAKFQSENYVKRLINCMKSNKEESKLTVKRMADDIWTKFPVKRLFSEQYTLESGNTAKHGSSLMMGGKRIAGTQRLIHAPPMIIPAKKGEVQREMMMKKPKKAIAVIDDSICSSTDKPCKVCSGVSVVGNHVLQCAGCKDCYHMRCQNPPITIEQASNPAQIFLCPSCASLAKFKPRGSRSSSPQTGQSLIDIRQQKLDADELKLKKFTAKMKQK